MLVLLRAWEDALASSQVLPLSILVRGNRVADSGDLLRVFGNLAMDLLLLVELVHRVFNRPTSVFRNVLHVLDLVFERLRIRLGIRSTKHAEVRVVFVRSGCLGLQPWRVVMFLSVEEETLLILSVVILITDAVIDRQFDTGLCVI